MLPNSGENLMFKFWWREDFPEAWLLRATCSIKYCKPTFLVHGDDFSQWADVRGESMH